VIRYYRESKVWRSFRHASPARIALIAAAIVVTHGCSQPTAQRDLREVPHILGYPPARWHLAQPSELYNTLLWVSHIVITHRSSQPEGDVYLRPGLWRPDPAPVERSERDALDLAVTIAAQAAAAPDSFPDLARRYSEDATTRDSGGSLGGVRATELPPRYLNALDVLPPGGVSAVIQSPWGFQIIRRDRVPPDVRVSGARIVVRYHGTLQGRSRSGSERTRDEALAIARDIEQRLRGRPDAFAAFAKEYSESFDADQSGDLGIWSLRSPVPLSREIEQLARLRVGELSSLLETPAGFELLVRQEVAERPVYAAFLLSVPFSPTQSPNSAGSRDTQLRLVRSLLDHIATDPAQFDLFRQRYCCAEPIRWQDGRGPPALSKAVDTLGMGATSTEPIESRDTFIIAKRIEPSSVPSDEVSGAFDLPRPAVASLDNIVKSSDGRGVAGQVRAIAASTLLSDALPTNATTVRGALTDLATQFEQHADARDTPRRVTAWQNTRFALERALAPGEFHALQGLMEAWAGRFLMTRPEEL
jgi:hypothetical protein